MNYTVHGTIRLSIHDLMCERCGYQSLDTAVDTNKPMPKCPKCRPISRMTIRLDIARRPPIDRGGTSINRDRAVVYRHPVTGKIAYPGQDTEFTRSKYEGWGYKREEFTSLRELDKFCKKENLSNEKANFNSGNGIN